MESFKKILTSVLTVGKERIVAASLDVRNNQRKVGRRHTLEIYNKSERIIFFGGQNLTPDSGIPILPGERRILPVVENAEAVYLIAENETDVVIAEYCV
ncbi:MAG: hypothetical protein IJ601_04370 [Acidaminococcaceae bacterium]|nr:hypothetical protein [Acidaminococcaceae bacterium]